MLPPERLLHVAHGHPELPREALLMIRAERELAEATVQERRLAMLERKVLLVMAVVAFVATLAFAALEMLDGAVGGAATTVLTGAALAARRLVCETAADEGSG